MRSFAWGFLAMRNRIESSPMGRMLEGFRGSSWLAPVGALTAGLFLAYLITLPPHLVHHLFDEDQGRAACPYFAQSQHSPELRTDPPTLTPPIPGETLQAFVPGAFLPRSDRGALRRHRRVPLVGLAFVPPDYD